MTGSFILYDLNKDHYLRYNPVRCKKRFIPAATFDIMISLIGLETGAVVDENSIIEWDKTEYHKPGWNRNHTLKSAITNSVDWYFQELARRIAKLDMWNYISKVKYGNMDISERIDSFWLNGKLRISQAEQIEILKKIYKNELPFSKKSIKVVKEILLLEKKSKYKLTAKTGSGIQHGKLIGWFVGYLEKFNNVYFFATNVERGNFDNNEIRNATVEMTKNVLKKFGLLL